MAINFTQGDWQLVKLGPINDAQMDLFEEFYPVGHIVTTDGDLSSPVLGISVGGGDILANAHFRIVDDVNEEV